MKTLCLLALAAALLPAAAHAELSCDVTIDGHPAMGLLGPMSPIKVGAMAQMIPHFARPVVDHNGVTRRPAITFSLGDEGDVLTVRVLDFSQTKNVGSYDSAKLLGSATAGLVGGRGRLVLQVGDVPGDPVITVDCR